MVNYELNWTCIRKVARNMTQDYCYVAACLLDGQIFFFCQHISAKSRKKLLLPQLLPHNVKLLVWNCWMSDFFPLYTPSVLCSSTDHNMACRNIILFLSWCAAVFLEIKTLQLFHYCDKCFQYFYVGVDVLSPFWALSISGANICAWKLSLVVCFMDALSAYVLLPWPISSQYR